MVTILGIESSCDDTSAAIVRDGILASNVIASQSVHEEYGGVVPELASRGPGLLGSLLVGTSFAKGLALALHIPLIDVNHLHAHVLSHFVRKAPEDEVPEFPFMALLISGGNSQIILVRSPYHMQMLGHTIDDAAGEAFDKCAKVMGLPYPGGPHIDRLAAEGDPLRFKFSKPHIPGLDYSFSGLKTSFLYTLRDNLKSDPDFIEKNRADLAASLQHTIIDILLSKLSKAVDLHPVRHIAIGGGVSANSGVRAAVEQFCRKRGIRHWIPDRQFTTDNAAMVAAAGYFKYLDSDFCDLSLPPYSRVSV